MTMEKHRASYSSLSMHRACPQRWNFANIRNLESIKDDEPPVFRDMGSWWHALRAADSLERGRALGSLRKVPRQLRTVNDGPTLPGEEATVLAVLLLAREWWDAQGGEYREEFEVKIGAWLERRLEMAYVGWQERWATEIAEERPLAVELGWGRDLPSVNGEDTLTRLVGYVDEVYLDTRRNIVVARDHKTGKELSTQTTVDDMMDSQLQLYAWGASPEVTSWGVGSIAATAYDRMRSVAPKPPQLTLGGRLRETNGQSNIGQVDLATYVEWAVGPDGAGVEYPGTKKDGSGAGLYVAEEDVIERLSAPAARSVWFQRTLTPLNMNIVRSHLRAAVDSALDVNRTRLRAEATSEAGRNLGSACRWCPFTSLCRAEMVGGPDGEYDLEMMNLRVKPKRVKV